MKQLNYFEEADKEISTNFLPRVGSHVKPDAINSIKYLLSLGRVAEKFVLPDEGIILDDEFEGLKGELLRLPYPVTMIEYSALSIKEEYVGKRDPASKRIIIAKETDDGFSVYHLHSIDDKDKRVLGRWMPIFGHVEVKYKKDSVFDFNITSQAKIIADAKVKIGENLAKRVPSPEAIAIGKSLGMSEEEASNTLNEMLEKLNNVPADKKDHLLEQLAKMAIASDPYHADTLSQPKNAKLLAFHNIEGVRYVWDADFGMDIKELEADLSWEFTVVLNLLEALSCSNVKAVNIQPQKHKKGQAYGVARARYVYKMLTVMVDKEAKPNEKPSGKDKTNNNDKRSYAEHLRRGHIRNQWYPSLQCHKKIWINKIIVNAGSLNGTIEKFYNVKKK
jgi:hypothetical protein